jgi:predicted amidohydrolase
MREAAAEGAQLVVLPECFIPFYPKSSVPGAPAANGNGAVTPDPAPQPTP